MDNQHKIIKGYRDLLQAEIDNMNRLKALAEQVGVALDEIDGQSKLEPDVTKRIDGRWLSIGRTQLQQGFMAAIRSIAKPTTF